MKSTFITLLCFVGITFSFAQQTPPATAPAAKTDSVKAVAVQQPAEKDPPVRFGLRITPSYNWYRSTTKGLSNAGGAMKFGGGVLVEFRLTKTVDFQTGFGVDGDGGSITYSNDPSGATDSYTMRYFYQKADEEIVEYADHRNDPAYQEYMLLERKYRVTYLSVPCNLKMKTAKMNDLRYFFLVGPEFQWRWKSLANDRVQAINNPATIPLVLGNETELTDLNVNKDAAFFNMSINLGVGFEYDIAGSTSLFVNLNYSTGLTNAVGNNSYYISKVYQTSPTTINESQLKQNFKSNVIGLTIGILF